jgi:hypothetical protein
MESSASSAAVSRRLVLLDAALNPKASLDRVGAGLAELFTAPTDKLCVGRVAARARARARGAISGRGAARRDEKLAALDATLDLFATAHLTAAAVGARSLLDAAAAEEASEATDATSAQLRGEREALRGELASAREERAHKLDLERLARRVNALPSRAALLAQLDDLAAVEARLHEEGASVRAELEQRRRQVVAILRLVQEIRAGDTTDK